MSAVTEATADSSSLILHRTKQTQLHIKRSVATRVRRYFIHQIKKTKTKKLVGICIYLVIFENTQDRQGTRLSVVKTLWWADSAGTESTRSLEQQISPVLEITETQHPHPLVVLFVHLSEGQSAAADRCVCSRFWRRKLRRGQSQVFPRSVPPGGKTGIKSGCPRLTFSHLSPGLVW